MRTLDEILRESSSLHSRLCPRQVLGARMALLAGRELMLELPRNDRRVLAIVETDGCVLDAIAAATGCRPGRRTLRVEDHGKLAATFVDVETGAALRIRPHPDARDAASRYAPEAESHWHAMLLGYQRMPDTELLLWQWVSLVTPLDVVLGRPGVRVRCDTCGEEVINQREVARDGGVLCRACAGGTYYRTSVPSAGDPAGEASGPPGEAR